MFLENVLQTDENGFFNKTMGSVIRTFFVTQWVRTLTLLIRDLTMASRFQNVKPFRTLDQHFVAFKKSVDWRL